MYDESEKVMTDYIEGRRPLIEALRADMPISFVLMADNIKKDSLLSDIERKCRQRAIEVKKVPKKKLDDLSERGSHQGVMGAAKPFEYAGIRDIATAAQAYAAQHDGRALVVVLDHITDAGNLGAIIRSADAVGASGIIIPSKRAACVGAATYKSSAGAVSHMPVVRVANISDALERLKKEGFWIAAASEQANDTIWSANLKGKIAFVMGNENQGVSRLVLENCDFAVSLPMQGKVGSLNVAQAFTACAYEWLRQNTL